MRWFMWALGVAYVFTVGYGLHQFQLMSVSVSLWVGGVGSVLWTLIFGVLQRVSPPLSWRALVWNGINLILLNLLLAFYATDTSKYLN